jgi:hypothetical protein
LGSNEKRTSAKIVPDKGLFFKGNVVFLGDILDREYGFT